MHISRLQFENFRNFQSLDIKLDQGFVVLCGPNGMGKTNLLEGIYFGASLRRFPSSKLRQLVQDGQSFMRVKIGSTKDEEQNLEVFCQQAPPQGAGAGQDGARYKCQFKLDNQKETRARYSGAVPVISFLPEDLNLLTHSPGARRRFLDECLSVASQSYRYALSQYERALQQRNHLWRKIQNHEMQESDLGIWDNKLSEFGCEITGLRQSFVSFINQNLQLILDTVSPKLQAVKFIYHNSGETDKANFLQKLVNLRPRERETGTTLVGPHRDDFEVFWQEREVVGYVSRGQLRSLTLALKILERNYLEQHLKERPIILLDDIFSEFDKEHRQQVIEFLRSFDQVFASTANLEEVKPFLPETAQIFLIRSGQIVKNGV